MKNQIYGFIKPYSDAHTLGIKFISESLLNVGYEVILGDDSISNLVLNIDSGNEYKLVNWILYNKISNIGLSYRLDENDALLIFNNIYDVLFKNELLSLQNGPISNIYFAGLPRACDLIKNKYGSLVTVFSGGESLFITLEKLDVKKEEIPVNIIEASEYDSKLLQFGKEIIDSSKYLDFQKIDRCVYKDYGTNFDTIGKRIRFSLNDSKLPLTRAHVGPYLASNQREDSVNEFIKWSKRLADGGYLDVLSIGSSQLTQSSFGENWDRKTNGGGVPINSIEEFRLISESSKPMLVRTYAGTKNIPKLAQIHEESLNISWHALSLWWFNKLDDRGPYDLYTNLVQHFKTLDYIATTSKPFEANVSHHFSFRGSDDIVYIVSVYLAAKLAKLKGIKEYIFQNMLNTPRYTWGIQDLAKSRAALSLLRSLEDNNFKVYLQPRAGLDFFSSDIYKAKIQLAAVSAMMDDIEPLNELSPEIIHIVSYSEAVFLANPDVVEESIKITQYSIQKYREMRKKGLLSNFINESEVSERVSDLLIKSKLLINSIEESIHNLYSPEGFYKVFAAGFFQTPYLWREKEEFKYALRYKTKIQNGSVITLDENGQEIDYKIIIDFAISNLAEIEKTIENLQTTI